MINLNLNTLSHIAKHINENNISWCIGASLLLNFHGLVDNPQDMDIIVDKFQAEQLTSLLSSLGKIGPKGSLYPYATEHFYQYIVEDLSVDIMGGFKILHEKGVYEFILDSQSIVDYKDINDVSIPLSSLEDWFVLYQLMPNREPKVALIEDYLKSKGVKHRKLLERALTQPLPEKVEARIIKLLKEACQ